MFRPGVERFRTGTSAALQCREMNLRISLSLALVLVTLSAPAYAVVLVYFDENGGSGSPRGLYDFDSDTRVSTLRTTLGGTQRFTAMDVRRSDRELFAVSLDGGLWNIDPDSGDTTLIGDTGLGSLGPTGIAFDPFTDRLLVLENSTTNLYEVDAVTAAASLIGTLGSGVDRGLSFSPSGELFAYNFGPNLYRIDPSAATATLVGGPTPYSMIREDSTFTPDGRLFVTDFDGNIYQTDPLSGLGAFTGNTGLNRGLLGLFSADSLIAVPEPATLWLAAIGLAAIGFIRRTTGSL